MIITIAMIVILLVTDIISVADAKKTTLKIVAVIGILAITSMLISVFFKK